MLKAQLATLNRSRSQLRNSEGRLYVKLMTTSFFIYLFLPRFSELALNLGLSFICNKTNYSFLVVWSITIESTINYL